MSTRHGGRWQRSKATLSPAEWRRAGGLAAAIIALHVIGFGVLVLVVAPQDLRLGSGAVFGLGLGVTAYTLGMRHAFDADHIAAIDNATRKLMGEGQRPLSVGFFFSLGHSSIVFVLAGLLALGIRGLSSAVGDDSSTLHQATDLVGPSISGIFLIAIGLVNLAALVGIVRVFLRIRTGAFDEHELEAQLQSRGVLTRVFARATDAIRQPWHMLGLGMLFGLGFDTATEVALLAAAGTAAAASGVPFYAILCLPVLFAAGMSLLDTNDGAFMSVAYGWAFAKPVRKVFYNMTVTGLSVAVALGIGTVELLSVVAKVLHRTNGVLGGMATIDLNGVGYAMVAMFAVTWLLALAVWRLGHIEERWARDVGER